MNTEAPDTAVTLKVGDPLSIKCGGLGNPSDFAPWDWTWSWSSTIGYTELKGCTGCTLVSATPINSANG